MILKNNKIYCRYLFRALIHMFDWGFLYLLLVIIFSFFISIWVIAGFCIFFLYYIINRFCEAVIYVDSISDIDDEILIEYFKFDNGLLKKSFSKENIKLKWYDSVRGNIKAPRLVVEVDDEIVFIQYAVGKWNRKKLLEVYNELNFTSTR